MDESNGDGPSRDCDANFTSAFEFLKDPFETNNTSTAMMAGKRNRTVSNLFGQTPASGPPCLRTSSPVPGFDQSPAAFKGVASRSPVGGRGVAEVSRFGEP